MSTTKYGPGDERTWGTYTGHPLDPRNDDEEEPDEEELRRDREDFEADRYMESKA